MTEPTPTESVAAYELTRYPPEKVLALIEAAKAAATYIRKNFPDWATNARVSGSGRLLVAAVDALTEGSTDRE